MANGGGDISFTAKELLARMDIKLDVMTEHLDKKADQGAVEVLRQRVELLEKETLTRAQYIPVIVTTKEKVEVLEGRYWRIMGGIAVLVVLASANALKIWIGF